MNAAQPKQFLPLKGKAILQHTIEAFHKVDPTFKYLVVLPEDQFGYWENHCKMKKFDVPHTLIRGGEERFYSVRNAVESISGDGIVLIHDGVRPLVSKTTIKKVIESIVKNGNGIPVQLPTETLRVKRGVSYVTVDRNQYVSVQTPQGFSVRMIKEAYRQAYEPSFTDDASVVEKTGVTIHHVEGNRENIKITDPFDLKLAEFLLGE